MLRAGRIIRRSAELVDKSNPVILLLASPLFLFPTPARAPTLLLVPILWLIARLAGRQPLPRTPLDGAFFLMVLMICVSLYATPDILSSLSKVIGLLFGVILFYTVVRAIEEPKQLALAIQLFIMSGAVLAAIALVGTNWLEKFPVLAALTKRIPKLIRGISGAEEGFHPNAVAGTLVMIIPLQIALLFGATTFRNELFEASPKLICVLYYLNLAMLVLTGGTLLLTQSRGAWVGLACSLVAFFAWRGRRSRRHLTLVFVLGVVTVILVGPSRFQAVILGRSGSNAEGNLMGRFELWSRAISAIQDFPITGMGMNIFRKAMPLLYPSSVATPDFDVSHAHNHLLQAALDLGLPGLIAYLALWFVTGYTLIRAFQLARHRWLRITAPGLGLGLMAHFVFGIGDAIPLGAKVGVFFWFELAVAVSLFRLVFRQVHDQLPSEANTDSRD